MKKRSKFSKRPLRLLSLEEYKLLSEMGVLRVLYPDATGVYENDMKW